LRGAEVPVARVATIPDVLSDPLVAPGLVSVRDPRTGLTIALPPPPVGEPPALSFPPRLGEHNERVYGALGLTAAEVGELTRRGIV
jgi:crotonobetainyl-CoA:carnitine CoA-transferase CaiB-like acyl-CoA transferase